MQKEIIEEVVLDQKENLKFKNLGIKRELKFDKLLSSRQIVVISGIRRSGKSTLLLQLMEKYDDYLYLNFDDERLINFTVADFQQLMLIFKKYSKSKTIFLDEIQNIEYWERFIRRIYDENYEIYLTGSNAKLLSSELATHLTGRYLKLELYPFSFKESLKYNEINYSALSSNTKANIQKEFDNYLIKGGFPEQIKYNDDEFVKRVYEDIIYKDLIVRFKVRNSKQFKRLSQYLYTNFTGELSYNSLKKALGIKSTTTVQEYVSYLEESYLIFELYKFDYSLKKQYTSNKKVYVIDNGIRSKIAFKFSDDKGKLLENLVFIELKRRGKEIYFYKTKNNREIDFLYREENTVHLIQVAYSLADLKTRERELNAFVETANEIPKTKNKLLTYNTEEEIEYKKINITIEPVWKWLLKI